MLVSEESLKKWIILSSHVCLVEIHQCEAFESRLFLLCKLSLSSPYNHLHICCYLFTRLFISAQGLNSYLILIWMDPSAWITGRGEQQGEILDVKACLCAWTSPFVSEAIWVTLHAEGLWMKRGISLSGSWVSYLAFFPLVVISMLMWAQNKWEDASYSTICYFYTCWEDVYNLYCVGKMQKKRDVTFFWWKICIWDTFGLSLSEVLRCCLCQLVLNQTVLQLSLLVHSLKVQHKHVGLLTRSLL